MLALSSAGSCPTSDRLAGMFSTAASLAFPKARCRTACDFCFFTLSGALLSPPMKSLLLEGFASLALVLHAYCCLRVFWAALGRASWTRQLLRASEKGEARPLCFEAIDAWIPDTASPCEDGLLVSSPSCAP